MLCAKTYVKVLRASVFLALTLVAHVVLARRANTPPVYPWHLANVWWTSPKATPSFSELAIDFEIVGTVADDVDLYIAPIGLVEIGGISAYGGIQTSMSGWPSKKDRRLLRIGRGGIFSRWSKDDQPLSLELATGPAGVHYEAADYENQFLSVRRRVDWKAGRYTYLLRRSPVARGLWFTASVREHASGVETEIGSLRFDDDDGSLGASIAAFVEVYGSRSVIPQVTVNFFEPRVDGARRAATKTSTVFPDNDSGSKMRFATASQVGERVVITTVPAGVRGDAKPRRRP